MSVSARPVLDFLEKVDVTAAAQELVAELLDRPWGKVSPSVYETGRLVTLVPWLTGDARRGRYLLETQRADGGWGAPDDGYSLLPTLSATEAILSVRGRRDPDMDAGIDDTELIGAARLGLGRLFDLLSRGGPSLPDMPAVELTVPYLIALINEHLTNPEPSRRRTGLEPWLGRRLKLPTNMDATKLTAVRTMVESGKGVPQKLLHALEITGDTARGLRHVRPESTGTIGASPAATAAWLGDRAPAEPGDPARWHLETVTSLHGGPVPCGFPVTVFERAWVLSWLVRSGLRVSVPPQVVLSLTAPLGPAGASAAAGLPADADTTAGALYALSLLGAHHRPDPLWEYETSSHFCTWQGGEDGSSTTTNAHVIEAFGQYLVGMGPDRIGRDAARRYAATAGKVAEWLREQQRADGSWTDRWHASPYYATVCCALALGRFGGKRSSPSVERARRWVLASQRADGSWGRWRGTPEETAYAVQILLNSGSPPDRTCVLAAARGRAHLLRSITTADGADDLSMWHDKDLYRPAAIVRAAVLAALHLLRTVPLHIQG